MVDKNINIGLGVTGADRVRQDFESVRQSIEGLDDAAIPAANSIVGAFETIEKAADRVESKIENGKNVTERDLKAMEQAYAQLSAAVEASFGSLENAPEELRAAHAVAEQQIASTIQAIEKVKASTDSVKEKFRELGTTSTDTGTKLTADQQRVADAFDRLKTNLAEFDAELAQTGNVGKGELEKIWKAQILLREEMERTGVSLDQLGANAVEEYARMEGAAKGAEATVRKLETGVEDAGKKANLASAQFTGFGDAMRDLDTPLGAFATKLGAVALAFKFGWDMGMKLHGFLGTDMQAWNSFADDVQKRYEGFGLKMGQIFSSIADNLVESFNFVKAKMTGDAAEADAAMNRLNESVNDLKEKAARGADEYKKAKDAETAATEQAAASQEKATQTAVKYTGSLADGTAKITNLTKETEKAAGVVIKWSDNVKQAADGTDRAARAAQTMATHSKDLDRSVDSIGTGLQDFAKGADLATHKIDNLTGKVRSTKAEIDFFADSIAKAVRELEKFDAASAKAAGAAEGGAQ